MAALRSAGYGPALMVESLTSSGFKPILDHGRLHGLPVVVEVGRRPSACCRRPVRCCTSAGSGRRTVCVTDRRSN